jgi:hypothetical protein
MNTTPISLIVFKLLIGLFVVGQLVYVIFGRFAFAVNYGVASIYKVVLFVLFVSYFLVYNGAIIRNVIKDYKFFQLFFILLLFMVIEIPFHQYPIDHLSGSIRFFVYWIGLMLVLMSKQIDLNNKIINFFIIIIFMLIIQLPFLIYFVSSQNLKDLLSGNFSHFGRLGFLFGSGNEDANMLAAIYPFMLMKIKRNYLLYIYLGIVLVAILINGTRTGLVYFLISSIFILYYFTKAKLIFILPLIGFFYILFYTSLIDILIFRIWDEVKIMDNNILDKKVQEGNLSLRLYSWFQSIKEVSSESPLIGFGAGSWDRIGHKVGMITAEGVTDSPHNLWVWLYVQWGIIGIIPYIVIVNKIFVLAIINFRFYSKNKQLANEYKLSVITLFSFIGYLVWATMSNAWGDFGMTIFLFLTILIIAQNRKSKTVLLSS